MARHRGDGDGQRGLVHAALLLHAPRLRRRRVTGLSGRLSEVVGEHEPFAARCDVAVHAWSSEPFCGGGRRSRRVGRDGRLASEVEPRAHRGRRPGGLVAARESEPNLSLPQVVALETHLVVFAARRRNLSAVGGVEPESSRVHPVARSGWEVVLVDAEAGAEELDQGHREPEAQRLDVHLDRVAHRLDRHASHDSTKVEVVAHGRRRSRRVRDEHFDRDRWRPEQSMHRGAHWPGGCSPPAQLHWETRGPIAEPSTAAVEPRRHVVATESLALLGWARRVSVELRQPRAERGGSRLSGRRGHRDERARGAQPLHLRGVVTQPGRQRVAAC